MPEPGGVGSTARRELTWLGAKSDGPRQSQVPGNLDTHKSSRRKPKRKRNTGSVFGNESGVPHLMSRRKEKRLDASVLSERACVFHCTHAECELNVQSRVTSVFMITVPVFQEGEQIQWHLGFRAVLSINKQWESESTT